MTEKLTPEEFVKYFCENYPGRTVISEPGWHAPKIYRAAIRASAHDDLLEACKLAIQYCACSIADRDSGHRIGCFVPDVTAAIAKAEGRE